VVTLAVYTVLAIRRLLGANDAVAPESETVPETGAPATVKINEDWLIVAGSISSLKVAVTIWFKGTPEAPSSGLVDSTTGHTPTIPLKPSLAQPEIKAINNNARVGNNFLVFIFFGGY
jgi:hypothetical protein